MTSSIAAWSKQKGRKTYYELRETRNRLGELTEVDTPRTIPSSSNFFDDEEDFDEILAFSNSKVGEVASVMNTTKVPHSETFENRVLFYIFSYQGYLKVTSPCDSCFEKGVPCECNPVLAAITRDKARIVSRYGDREFEFDLARGFKLRKPTNFNRYQKVSGDQLTPNIINQGIILPSEEIILTERIWPTVRYPERLTNKQSIVVITADQGSQDSIKPKSLTPIPESGPSDDQPQQSLALMPDPVNLLVIAKTTESASACTGGEVCLSGSQQAAALVPVSTTAEVSQSASVKPDQPSVRKKEKSLSALEEAIKATTIMSTTSKNGVVIFTDAISSGTTPVSASTKNTISSPQIDRPSTIENDPWRRKSILPSMDMSLAWDGLPTAVCGAKPPPPSANPSHPHKIRLFCLNCKSVNLYNSGLCTNLRCNYPFSNLPAFENVSDAPYRYYPKRNSFSSKRECEIFEETRKRLFPGGEVYADGPLTAYREGCEDLSVQVGLIYTNADSVYDYIDRLEDFYESTECIQYRQDPLNREKLDFVTSTIHQNQLLRRDPRWDDLWSMPPDTLSMQWDGSKMEMGVTGRNFCPIGVAMGGVMLDLHHFVTKIWDSMKVTLDISKYPRPMGQLHYDPKRDAFYEMHHSGKRLKEVDPCEVVQRPEAPWVPYTKSGPRSLFLGALYQHLEKHKGNFKERGLEYDSLAKLNSLADEASRCDERRADARERMPLFRQLPDSVTGSVEDYVVAFAKAYGKTYQKVMAGSRTVIPVPPVVTRTETSNRGNPSADVLASNRLQTHMANINGGLVRGVRHNQQPGVMDPRVSPFYGPFPPVEKNMSPSSVLPRCPIPNPPPNMASQANTIIAHSHYHQQRGGNEETMEPPSIDMTSPKQPYQQHSTPLAKRQNDRQGETLYETAISAPEEVLHLSRVNEEAEDINDSMKDLERSMAALYVKAAQRRYFNPDIMREENPLPQFSHGEYIASKAEQVVEQRMLAESEFRRRRDEPIIDDDLARRRRESESNAPQRLAQTAGQFRGRGVSFRGGSHQAGRTAGPSENHLTACGTTDWPEHGGFGIGGSLPTTEFAGDGRGSGSSGHSETHEDPRGSYDPPLTTIAGGGRGSGSAGGSEPPGGDPSCERCARRPCCCVHKMRDRRVADERYLVKRVEDARREARSDMGANIKLMGLPKYNENKFASFNHFYMRFLFFCKAQPLTENQKKMVLYQAFESHRGGSTQTRIMEWIQFNEDITATQIATKLMLYLDANSHLSYENQLRELSREDNERIEEFAWRVETIYHGSLQPSQLEEIRGTAHYEAQKLKYFLIGLRSQHLRRKIKEENVKTLTDATFLCRTIIDNVKAVELEGKHDKSLIPLSSENSMGSRTKKLTNKVNATTSRGRGFNRGRGKNMRVNAMSHEDDQMLEDMDSSETHEEQSEETVDAECLTDDEEVNALGGKNVSYAKGASSSSGKPANSSYVRLSDLLNQFPQITCFRCGEAGHIASYCLPNLMEKQAQQYDRIKDQPKSNPSAPPASKDTKQANTVLKTTPAHDRRVKTAKNFKGGNRVYLVEEIDQEEEQILGEPEDVEGGEDISSGEQADNEDIVSELVNALRQRTNQKPKPKKFNALESESKMKTSPTLMVEGLGVCHLDTGAEASFVPKSHLKRLRKDNPNIIVRETNIQVYSDHNNQKMITRRSVTLPLKLEDDSYRLTQYSDAEAVRVEFCVIPKLKGIWLGYEDIDNMNVVVDGTKAPPPGHNLVAEAQTRWTKERRGPKLRVFKEFEKLSDCINRLNKAGKKPTFLDATPPPELEKAPDLQYDSFDDYDRISQSESPQVQVHFPPVDYVRPESPLSSGVEADLYSSDTEVTNHLSPVSKVEKEDQPTCSRYLASQSGNARRAVSIKAGRVEKSKTPHHIHTEKMVEEGIAEIRRQLGARKPEERCGSESSGASDDSTFSMFSVTRCPPWFSEEAVDKFTLPRCPITFIDPSSRLVEKELQRSHIRRVYRKVDRDMEELKRVEGKRRLQMNALAYMAEDARKKRTLQEPAQRASGNEACRTSYPPLDHDTPSTSQGVARVSHRVNMIRRVPMECPAFQPKVLICEKNLEYGLPTPRSQVGPEDNHIGSIIDHGEGLLKSQRQYPSTCAEYFAQVRQVPAEQDYEGGDESETEGKRKRCKVLKKRTNDSHLLEKASSDYTVPFQESSCFRQEIPSDHCPSVFPPSPEMDDVLGEGYDSLPDLATTDSESEDVEEVRRDTWSVNGTWPKFEPVFEPAIGPVRPPCTNCLSTTDSDGQVVSDNYVETTDDSDCQLHQSFSEDYTDSQRSDDEVNKVHTLHHSISKLTSKLPFAKVRLLPFREGGKYSQQSSVETSDDSMTVHKAPAPVGLTKRQRRKPKAALALLDTGATLSLVSSDFLKSLPYKFEVEPVDVRASSFTGDPIKILGKTKALIDFGMSLPSPVELYVHDGAATDHEVLIGWPAFEDLSLELDARDKTLRVRGHPIALHDTAADRVNIISAIKPEKCLATVNVSLRNNITIQRKDQFQVILDLELDDEEFFDADVGEIFHLEVNPELTKAGINILDGTCQLLRDTGRKGKLHTMAILEMAEDSPNNRIHLQKGSPFGKLVPVISLCDADTAKGHEAVQMFAAVFCKSKEEAEKERDRQNERFHVVRKIYETDGERAASEYMKVNPGTEEDSILFFPVKRVLTEKEEKEIEDSKEYRRQYWTEDKLRERFESDFKNLPSQYHEDFMRVLRLCCPVFAINNDCLRHHASDVLFDAIFPDSLSLHVQNRFTGSMSRFINARMQENMVRRNQLAPSQDGGVASHLFLVVPKPHGQPAADVDALNEMSDEQCDKTYRCVFDVSTLTPLCKPHPFASPIWLEALCTTPADSKRSLSDVGSMFYQLGLTDNASRLFVISSSIPSAKFLKLRVLPQGFCLSTCLSGAYTIQAVEGLNGIEPRLSFDEFLKKLEQIEAKQLVESDRSKLLPCAYGVFVDDISLCSPETADQCDVLGLTDESFERSPVSREEIPFLLHMSLLRRLWTALLRRNFLLSSSKNQLFINDKTRYKWLGIEYEAKIAYVPEATARTITTLASPSNQRQAMRLLGISQFYGMLIPGLRVRTVFLSDKLKKGQTWSWSEKDEANFRSLLQAIAAGHMPGLVRLLSPTLGSARQVYVQSDWAEEQHASSMIVLVKYVEDGVTKTSVACSDSRKLPDSYRQKSSCLAEFASFAFGILSLRQILLPFFFVFYTDNLALIYILASRYRIDSPIKNKQIERLMISIMPFHFVARHLPADSMERTADVLSRFELEKGMPIDRYFANSTSLEDFEELDSLLKLPNREKNAEAFLLRQEKNRQMIMDIENARGMNPQEAIHYFGRELQFSKHAKEIISHVNGTLSIEDEHEEDKRFWKENIAFDTVIPEPVPSDVLDILQEQDRVNAIKMEADAFNPEGDYLETALPTNEATNLTEEGLKWVRMDCAQIAKTKAARDLVLNPPDGMVDISHARASRECYDQLSSVNYIYHHAKHEECQIPDEPLFQSLAEVKENLPKAQLSQSLKSYRKHFLEVQDRNEAISTIKNVLMGKMSANDIQVDAVKRLDTLGRRLVNNLDHLVLLDGLLLKLKVPLRQEHCCAVVVLPESDAERFCLRLHVAGHRSAMHLLATASCKIWSVDLADICASIVRSCVVCAAFFHYGKSIKCSLPNREIHNGSVSFDVKGPILSRTKQGLKKRYVLVTVDQATGYHSLALLEDLSAKEFATKFFDGYIKWFGIPLGITCDLGSSFTSKIALELYTLISVPVRFVSCGRACANVSESAVGRFSRALKAVLGGDSILSWTSKLGLVQLVLNSSYIHPHSNRTPLEMWTGFPYNNLYTPFVLFETEAEKAMSKLSRDRVALLRSIVTALREKHKTYISVAVNPDKTINSLNLKVGSKVWYRVFKHPRLVDGLGSLLPGWLGATIVRVFSKTTVLVESDLTGRLLNRHISDIQPRYAETRFLSTENSEEGFKALTKEMCGGLEGIRELETEAQQMQMLEGAKESLKKGEAQVRRSKQMREGSTERDTDPVVRPKQMPLRRSRRQRGLSPKEDSD